MQQRTVISIAFLIIIFLAFFSFASTQVDKQDAIKKSFAGSLHATGNGMKYWHSKEQGGVEKIFDVPYDQLNCSGCHVKSCDACHKKKENEKGEHTFEPVQSDAVCLKCHFVENAEIEKLKNENTPADVHFKKGMKCMDCHTAREMHGDGKQYNTFQQPGAMDTRCKNCHKELNEKESHKVHGNKLSCNACHVRNIPTCYNCHLNPNTKQGKSVSPQLSGLLFLVNHNDQVTAANLHTFVTGDKTMIVFSPFFSHSVMKEGRICTDCHNTEILRDLKNNDFYPVTWENGKLKNVKGVIPVHEKVNWKFVYLKNENDKWVPIEHPAVTELNYSGFCTPLTREQLNKLEKSPHQKE